MEKVFCIINDKTDEVNHALEMGCTVKVMKPCRTRQNAYLYLVLELSKSYINEERRKADEKDVLRKKIRL